MSQRSYLIRVSADVIDQLTEADTPPVVVMRVTCHHDGTHELIVRRVEDYDHGEPTERYGAGTCLRGNCDEPCGPHGGCVR